MSGLAELITVAARWRSWDDPRFVVLVLNNRDLAEVTWEQREKEGDARFAPSQDLPDVRYAEIAKVLGLGGVRIDSPDAIGAAWDEALSADSPFVIDAVVDPAVPLLPPDQPFEQIANMYTGLEKEDDAAARENLLRQRAAEGHDDRNRD